MLLHREKAASWGEKEEVYRPSDQGFFMETPVHRPLRYNTTGNDSFNISAGLQQNINRCRIHQRARKGVEFHCTCTEREKDLSLSIILLQITDTHSVIGRLISGRACVCANPDMSKESHRYRREVEKNRIKLHHAAR